MRLLVKLNVVLLVVFAIALAATAQISWTLLERNARTEIADTARLLMDAALATRSYTSSQINPLLDTQSKYTFLPQSVPAYSATEVFTDLRKNHPQFAYKEATLNPTNPRDRAVEWETDIISQYRNGGAGEIIGTRATPSGDSFYVTRPIKITNGACLRCHSTVDAAPRTMLDRYGPSNGFGWQLNEVVGAQIVSVPTVVPLERAESAFTVFMGSMAAVFVIIALVLNLMLWRVVTRPVVTLSNLADRISLGDLDLPEFKSNRLDEIGVLAKSIGRMRASLVQAMKMLET
jgi:HAMP domain-containing protein